MLAIQTSFVAYSAEFFGLAEDVIEFMTSSSISFLFNPNLILTSFPSNFSFYRHCSFHHCLVSPIFSARQSFIFGVLKLTIIFIF